MGPKLSTATTPAHEALLTRLHRAGRFLDALAESSTGTVDYALARVHANTVWQAAGKLDDYATLIHELDHEPQA